MASTTDPFENAMQPHPGHLLLRTLEESDADALERAVASWPPGENTVFAPGFRRGEDFAGYVALLEAQARGERLPERWVPSLTMFGFVGGTIVGRLQLRMHLNDFLLRVGGNIGYAVLPAYRGRGFAGAMLEQALPIARRHGLTRVLLTCDEGNVASMRTIERAGGILEDVVPVGEGQPRKRRYWIELSLTDSSR
jgi:predicted acetyltransferase